MTENLNAVQKQAKIEQGALFFFRRHPELNSCDANMQVLASEIESTNLPLDNPDSWEAAFKSVGSQLAPVSAKRIAQPEPASWDFPFPEIRTVADIRRMPSKMYRDFWFDKSHGELTQKALDFRSVVESIIANENADAFERRTK